ncbi:hypothetical protein LTR70_008740 [Exophiala xenobiotica]|uniref:Uncharacterized protein n=1 Tax=Lithohypha guttulata TaxID=1690604 RepID=A0ABR0JZJ2_9EURO|nr:hypothetical protein LTR24_008576 [Lithohypha guttulata]KAK5311513.1 hypothetical protein LTR70_008740 [Exophiala xenobiotica]
MLSRAKPVPEWYSDYYTSINADPNLLNSNKTSQAEPSTHIDAHASSDKNYHILITSSHLAKDPTHQVEKLRVIGTYDSPSLAKAAAHRALFDAGYEAEFFKAYGVSAAYFDEQHVPSRNRDGLLVHAIAQDGTVFQVRIVTTPNDAKWTHQFEDGRICKELYYVVRTRAHYGEGSDGEASWSYEIDGAFERYEDARKLALHVLVNEADGVTKENYEQYDEVAPDENDCGYGENVLVHAVGQNGENLLVSVVKGQILEWVRLMEASMRIR